MALLKGKSKGNKSKDGKDFKKKGNWASLGAVWESEKYDGLTFFTSTYSGTLLFLAKDKDGGSPKLYKIKKASVQTREEQEEKGRKVPDSLVLNLNANLENENNEVVDLEKLESLEDLLEDSDSGN
jgi:hypothetical protein